MSTIVRRPRQSRTKATTFEKDQYLTKNANRHSDITAKEFYRDFAAATGKTISRQTSQEHASWGNQEWRRVLFTDESRFSTNSNSRRVFISREPVTHYHHSNIREHDRIGGSGTPVWGGIILDGRTPLHIFDAGSVTAPDEALEPNVRLYRGAIGQDFTFMDNK
ncbi:transposable element Tc1 transposase [Trichonephila clavipes]|uniref:Transposable element Tc1 transposase n=1 Tax=Trichonephila clavipes TaxID=2585209 RepID=A0A8X6RZD5_TRICX|nr:transposable element Tc1 transposase [Trichonephila clavipes]